MTRHPGDHGYTAAPGPALVDARRSAETRQTYTAVTERLARDAWGPVQPPGNGFLTAAFNATDNHRAGAAK